MYVPNASRRRLVGIKMWKKGYVERWKEEVSREYNEASNSSTTSSIDSQLAKNKLALKEMQEADATLVRYVVLSLLMLTSISSNSPPLCEYIVKSQITREAGQAHETFSTLLLFPALSIPLEQKNPP